MSGRKRFDVRQATQPLLIAMGVLLVLNIGLYVGLVRPKVVEWRALNQENSPRAKALQDRQAEVEKLETFVQGLKQAKDDLEHLRTEVLSTRDERLVEVQAELERLVTGEKIDLESVNFEHDALGAEGLQVLRMIVPLEGGYASLRSLLNKVENSDLFLVVERVTLGMGQDGGVMLQLNVTIATYFNAPVVPRERRNPRRSNRA